MVHADHGPVRGDRDHVEAISLAVGLRLGHRGAGHPAEPVVLAQVVPRLDRRERLRLGADRQPFLGLDGLVLTLAVATVRIRTAGLRVDDHGLTAVDDIVPVLPIQFLGLERVQQGVDQLQVPLVVQVGEAEPLLDPASAGLGQRDGPALRVGIVMLVGLEPGGDPRALGVPGPGLLGGRRYTQRGFGIVDEDQVGLVDDREMVPALNQLPGIPGQVVTQVVVSELLPGTVGDVRAVLRLAGSGLLRHLRRLQQAGPQAEELVHRPHPLRVAPGQVVVRRQQVDAGPGQRVQVPGQGGGQRLAIPGDLYVVVPLAERTRRGLAHGRERFRQQVVQRLAGRQPGPERAGQRAELVVAAGLHRRLPRADLRNDVAAPAQDLFIVLAARQVRRAPPPPLQVLHPGHQAILVKPRARPRRAATPQPPRPTSGTALSSARPGRTPLPPRQMTRAHPVQGPA